jgi:DNA-binding NarL/FixJ family response regulator
MEVLQAIRKHSPGTHVIMLSSQERYGIAMQTLQKGAEQYVIKDSSSFQKISNMVNEM